MLDLLAMKSLLIEFRIDEFLEFSNFLLKFSKMLRDYTKYTIDKKTKCFLPFKYDIP